jgi:hypothetical protein
MKGLTPSMTVCAPSQTEEDMILREIIAASVAVAMTVPLMIIGMSISACGARCRDERRSVCLERKPRRRMDEDVRNEDVRI